MRVLLVEDSVADARFVRETLFETDRNGFDLVHVRRLSEALARLSSESFDAVLLDLGLPDARGLEALSPVRDAVPDVPVVVLSGLSDEDVAVEAVQSGAQDYLLKGQGDGGLIARSLRYAVERKRAEQHIHHLATHDGLTGLPNRRLLLDRLGQALASTRREKRLLALLFLDLDGFKAVNDTFGHAIGDQVLQDVASRLSACVRESDTVARLGGDEFTIVLQEISHPQDANRFAAKILEAFEAPFSLRGHHHRVSASIGIGLYPNDGESPEALMRAADLAMYRAKQRGSAHYEFHSDSLRLGPPERQLLGSRLRHALEDAEFVLHYQPRIDARSGKVVGTEVLLRWEHPEWGLVLPSRFIPLAEEMGLIESIGEWVMRRACAQAQEWNAAGAGEPLLVSVNLSSREFGGKHLRQTVERALHDSGLTPSALELELTESGLARNEGEAIVSLRELHAMGVRISIDDFGTGYSSMSRLRRFPIDALKIDRSFVEEVVTDRGDAAIVAALITMGHGMRLRVTAEGVEAADQMAFLRRHECDEMQGYFFGAPQSPESIVRLLANPPKWVDP